MSVRLAIVLALSIAPALALDPHKALTQYSRTTWTQMQGLPQDTIRAIAQTTDGYLWLGTDEGLARFDGYEFVMFHKANGDLPSNSITALAPAADGGLWIGTSNGLVHYRDKQFRTYTTKDGLPDDGDHAALCRPRGHAVDRRRDFTSAGSTTANFTTLAPGADLPLDRRAQRPRGPATRPVDRGAQRASES